MWLLVAIAASVVLGPRVFTTPAPAADEPGEVIVATGAPGSSVLPLQAPSMPRGPSPTVVLTPSVVIPDEPPTTEAPAAPPPAPAVSEPATTEAPTATTEAPTTTTTAAPVPSTTTTAAPTTTTTAPPPPPPAAPAPGPAALSASHDDGVHEGMVSWYDLPGARPGVCAHRTIDKGTVVTVTNLDSGKSITCTVDDRGPYSGDGKVLDLHKDDFSRLAPLEEGVFPARLDW